MGAIASNILSLKSRIPGTVRIVAVSKTRSPGEILEAYNTGHRLFGENRVQELLAKKDLLPGDIEWHLIGHLQTNKVKAVTPFIKMIESVDSLKLLSAVDQEAGKIGRNIDCLLQVHIAEEESKFGFSRDEIIKLAQADEFSRFKNVTICGVMGMATFTDKINQVRQEFRSLAHIYSRLKETTFRDYGSFKEISMGMSDDYETALEEGTTLIRIGSLIFGKRK